MKLVFFTDPHLGLERTTNTTSASKKRMQDSLFDIARECANAGEPGTARFCLGDLFDKYSNPEDIIRQGLDISASTDLTLAGNHDCRNRIDTVSSLGLIASMFPDDVVINQYGEVGFRNSVHEDVTLFFVPHCSGQDLFDVSLKAAEDNAKQCAPGIKFLCLHCNYDRDFGHDIDNDPALNLSAGRAKELLETFAYILIGHEHEPLTDHDGRVMVLGNTMPLGFGEIADRFMYTFDTETKQWAYDCIWSRDEEYLELSIEQLLAMDLANDLIVSESYVKVIGTVEPSQYPDVSKALAHFWKANGELLMVKPEIEVNKPTDKSAGLPNFVRATIPQMIATDLEGTELAGAYAECVQDEASD